MDLSSHIVREGSHVIGVGVVIIDESGDAYLAPNSPALDPRQSGRTIPLRYSEFYRHWDGVWVTLEGRFTNGGVDVSSIDPADRPDFPSEVTVHVTNPNGSGWTRTAFLAAAEFTDLHSTGDQIYGSGGKRDKDGTDTLTLDCLYIDESFADWLGRGHPGDIEVRSTLVPRAI